MENQFLVVKNGSVKSIEIDLGGKKQILNGFKYRMQGHKFVIPDAASEKLYEAFGGFDLDDKVLSDMHFIKDSSGARRLASFVWRQPTGPQEYAIMFPHLDHDSVSRLLGAETEFAERFQSLAGAASDLISLDRLKRIPTAKVGITASELELLNREEKIVKYLALMSRGNRAAAMQYVQGKGFEDYGTQTFFDDVERAIFRVMDIGNLDESGKATMGLEFADSSRRIDAGRILRYMGGSEEVLSEVDELGRRIITDNRIIRLPKLSDKILEKTLTGELRNITNPNRKRIRRNDCNKSSFCGTI